VDRWCAESNRAAGAVVELERAWALATEWYSRRSQRGWSRLAVEEAQRVLSNLGLNDEFWNLTKR
jgi:endonuclease/exonuclease/phosphatase (EEP) superfamily protein YafD